MASPKQVSEWLASIAGQTGVNSAWLKRAADAGVIRPGMSPDEIYRAVGNMASPPPVRQLELPIGPSAQEPDIRALIPQRGPGVPAGLSAPGVPVEPAGDLIEAPLRGLPQPRRVGLPAPQQPRLTYRGGDGLGVGNGTGPSRVIATRDPGYRGYTVPGEAPGPYDDLDRAFRRPLRNSPAGSAPETSGADLASAARKNIAAARRAFVDGMSGVADSMPSADTALKVGAPLAAAGAGLYALHQRPVSQPPTSGEMTGTGGTEDLAEESRPAPKVPAEPALSADEAAFADTFKKQYTAREEKRKARGQGGYAQPAPAPAPANPSDQAKAILRDLNERRRRAGGEVPEAPQMIAEANRLLAQGNAIRNAPGYKPSPMSNPREQATALLQRLNADRRAAGGEVPNARAVLAEVDRLHRLADQQDWGR